MNNYKLGSLFDGSGGFPLAGALCGIEPVWAAEVEPYPIAVTRSRFPKMKHLGDISKVNGAEIEPVDIITFGSPCQDLSVAGKRAGLKHTENGDEETTRSGLFMEAVRIIKEMRKATNGQYPTFALWENVPGAFSSNAGQDFRVVCEELIKIVEPTASMPEVPQKGWNYSDSYIGDGWSLAYRVLDAQYWGVPQRRRRIYLVADFRGERAREVLFEREGLRGYFTQGRTPWQTTPTDAQRSIGADDREGEGFDGYNGDLTGDKSATLGVNCGLSSGRNGVIERGGRQLDDVAYTLKIRSGCEGGGKGALVQENKSATLATNNDQYLFQPVGAFCPETGGNDPSRSVAYQEGVSPTLRAGFTPATVYGFDAYNQALTGDKAKTLNSAASDADHVPCTVYSVENHPADSRVNLDESGKVQTLTSRMGTGGGNVPMVMEPFCKSARPRSADDATTWIPGKTANTLNTFDQGETSANELVVQEMPVICMATQQGGAEIRTDDKAPTLTAAAGMSGNNQPVICLQGNGIDRADTAGCNGKGWKEDTAYTLNTIDRPAVAYSFDSLASNSMKSKNPHSGCREVEVAKTLDTTDPNPSKNQGGIAVVQKMPTFSINHQGGNTEQIIEEKTGTITAAVNSSGNNKLSVAYGLDRASFNQGQNAKFDFTVAEESQPTLTARGPGAVAQPIYNASKASFFMRATEDGPADTLVATDYKDPQLVAYGIDPGASRDVGDLFIEEQSKTLTNGSCPGHHNGVVVANKVGSLCATDYKGIRNQDIGEGKAIVQEMPQGTHHYIVRRLTPTECARLQGFADRWGDVDAVDHFSQKDYQFWMEVRNTHARINGKKEQEYTVKQMLTWYNKLQTDSSEYKMWGNGIALPTALYVLQGITDALTSAENEIEDWML